MIYNVSIRNVHDYCMTDALRLAREFMSEFRDRKPGQDNCVGYRVGENYYAVWRTKTGAVTVHCTSN